MRTGAPKKYLSDAMASIHESVADLYKVGGINKKTMRKFDVLCLTPIQQKMSKNIVTRDHREKVCLEDLKVRVKELKVAE